MKTQHITELVPQGKPIEEFLNLKFGTIGRTVSTRSAPSTSSEFSFWITDQEKPLSSVEIGNIIAAYSDKENDITFGQIVEMMSFSSVEDFFSDFVGHEFGRADLEIPTDVPEIVVARCAVLRNISEKTRPPERSRVYFPSEKGIEFAYGLVDSKGEKVSRSPIPVGVFENGDKTTAPICVDEDFLVGPEGAHLNASGISGLATKTSSILFTLKSLLQFTEKNIAVVIFNVKGRDLLYLDCPNPEVTGDTWSGTTYDKIGIPRTPFTEAAFYAPAYHQNSEFTRSQREKSELDVHPFIWGLTMIYQNIPSLFSPEDWDDKTEGVWLTIQEQIERIMRDEQGTVTYQKILRWVERQINKASDDGHHIIFGNHIATWRKVYSHLQRFPKAYPGLIATSSQGKDIPWHEMKKGSVYVVDMEMLDERAQKLVFGRSMDALRGFLESGDTGLDAVVVFVDELNKFAPAGSARAPLKQRLIEVTARGRGLGLVLFGAQQFASAVDKEIFDNCSTHLLGRTEVTELRSPNYAMLSDEIKSKMTKLNQGELLVKFAKFPNPVFIKFPHPPSIPGNLYTK